MNSILHLTLLDRTRKKIAFVRRAALTLGRPAGVAAAR